MVVLTWATVPLCMGGEGFEGSSFLNAMTGGYLTFCRPSFFFYIAQDGRGYVLTGCWQSGR